MSGHWSLSMRFRQMNSQSTVISFDNMLCPMDSTIFMRMSNGSSPNFCIKEKRMENVVPTTLN